MFVVDDDRAVRDSLELLVQTGGWRVETFASPREFLSRPRPAVPCCLVLDVSLPGLSGLELQARVAERSDMPLVFLTGSSDIAVTARAVKAGARSIS